MGVVTGIEWCDATANFWWGCVEVGPGCDHCYAAALDKRFGGDHWGTHNRRRFIASVWKELNRWNETAGQTGERQRVFVMSMGDFLETVPHDHPDFFAIGEARAKALAKMQYDWAHLDFLILTKRISNAKKLLPSSWLKGHWPVNVRLGSSVTNQHEADRDIPRLLQLRCPNFISYEPALGPVDFSPWLPIETIGGVELEKWLDWIIIGGESGPHARPFDLAWARQTVQQCKNAGVPVFVKQMGSKPHTWAQGEHWPLMFKDKKGSDINEFPCGLRVRQFPIQRGVG